MDKYMKHHNYNSLPGAGDNNRYTSRCENNTSFSSSLLDQIYRSIDQTNHHHVADDDDELVPMMKNKKHYIHTTVDTKDQARIDKNKGSWETSRQKSAASHHTYRYQRKIGKEYGGAFMNLNSSWSSAGAGLFSSEAADSNYGVSSRSSSTINRPKPIRTSCMDDVNKTSHAEKRNQQPQPQPHGVVKRSKLKALKIYGDLKNVKQPISPGAKLATFLNSLFTTGGNIVKKGKTPGPISSNTTTPACSTSRSCLRKTTSTRGKLSDSGTKRSVQFNPVSVIVDADCQPCGHKSLQLGQGRQDLAVPDQQNCVNEELMYHMRTTNQSVKEAAREIFKNCERRVESEDDDASYASSDLFELDSLHKCGINARGDYMEELPVYETTHLHTNLAA